MRQIEIPKAFDKWQFYVIVGRKIDSYDIIQPVGWAGEEEELKLKGGGDI